MKTNTKQLVKISVISGKKVTIYHMEIPEKTELLNTLANYNSR